MLREKHDVFLGKKYIFTRVRGGGGKNIRFRPKYRPLQNTGLFPNPQALTLISLSGKKKLYHGKHIRTFTEMS